MSTHAVSPIGRYYPIELQPTISKYWSVTTILSLLEKPALVQWAANCAVKHVENAMAPYWNGDCALNNEEVALIYLDAKTAHKNIKQEAADVGTSVHDAIEVWARAESKGEVITYKDMGLWVDNKDPVFVGLQAFLDWSGSVKLNPIESEMMIWSNQHRYAGRFDMLCTMQQGRQRKPRTYLIDVKTSSGIYPLEMGMQLAAYANAYNECNGKYKIDGVGIIRVDKEKGVPEWWDATDQLTINWERFKTLAHLYYLIKGEPQ